MEMASGYCSPLFTRTGGWESFPDFRQDHHGGTPLCGWAGGTSPTESALQTIHHLEKDRTTWAADTTDLLLSCATLHTWINTLCWMNTKRCHCMLKLSLDCLSYINFFIHYLHKVDWMSSNRPDCLVAKRNFPMCHFPLSIFNISLC